MSNRSETCERILHEIESRLCSGNKRENEWRTLARTMRAQKMRLDIAQHAMQVFLGDHQAGSGIPLPQPAGGLSDKYPVLQFGERTEVDNRYRECLEAARREFPFLNIEVINVPARPADFAFAARTDERLPGLNENQRSIAKVFGIPEEKYQLEVQAKLYGEERYRLFAERFWAFVMDAGKSYSLDSVDVVYDVAAGKFYCELKSDGGARRAAFAADVISVPIERGDKEGILRARDAVKVWLEEVLGRFAPAHS